MSEVKPLKKLEGYAILANQMDRDEIDLVKVSEKYGNSVKQLANWMRSLTATDYGYKYLKKEGYSEDQIADWVRRTPAEKVRKVRNKSSNETLSENLLREGEKIENETFSNETDLRNDENLRLSNEKNEKFEKNEGENLRIPQPDGNKGTQSTGDSLKSQVSNLKSSQISQVSSLKSQKFSNFSTLT